MSGEEGAGRVVAFRRSFVGIAGGVMPALFLSQARHWQRHYGEGRWWIRSRQDWEDELGMTRRQQETCRRLLRERGLIEERRVGMPPRIECRVVTGEALRKLIGSHSGGTSPNTGRNQPQHGAEPAPMIGRNQPSHLCETEYEKIKRVTIPVDPDLLPGSGSGVRPQARPEGPDLAARPINRADPGEEHTGAPGPRLDEVVMALWKSYPHPQNQAAARRRPNPVAIEGWLGELMRLGRLAPGDFHLILRGIERERRLAERDPKTYRRVLKTWVTELGWRDALDEDEPGDGPALPPPSSGPKTTPAGWA